MGAVLEKLSLFITNDTGPLHLALAMKTKTLSLFTPTDPAICGPYLANDKVLQAAPTCFPCLKKKCQEAFCMRQIGPEAVIATALKLLKGPI
jgi:ADP-heptose:LPS heptosyltransferase